MITKKTVFVLGAGASKPYGFPLGPELRDRLCGAIQGSWLAGELERLANMPQQDTHEFSRDFLHSGLFSIDTYLAHRTDHAHIGRYAIAAELCQKEDSGSLVSSDPSENWYRLLWNEMVFDAKRPHDIGANQVKFITFNYDRSLECFLQISTRNTFKLDDKKAFESWCGIPVLHVYGALGTFHPDEDHPQRRMYAPQTDRKMLETAAAGIRVIPESRDTDPCFQRAQEWFMLAEQICFLGFGFDPLNMRRLNLPPIFGRGNRPPLPFAAQHLE